MPTRYTPVQGRRVSRHKRGKEGKRSFPLSPGLPFLSGVALPWLHNPGGGLQIWDELLEFGLILLVPLSLFGYVWVRRKLKERGSAPHENIVAPPRGTVWKLAAVLFLAFAPMVSAIVVPLATRVQSSSSSQIIVSTPPPQTASTILSGQQVYQQSCQYCHGATGRGDGPIADQLKPRPADLSVHVPLHTEIQLYTFISKGLAGTAMPAFEKVLTPEQIWQVIAYISTFAKTLE